MASRSARDSRIVCPCTCSREKRVNHTHVTEPFRPLLYALPHPPWLARFCHWEDRMNSMLCFSLFRIHLEDLSQSVLLHMTEKLGYKNSDVINTVLSNRASHTLAIYFLLNKKLERYLASLRVSTAWCRFFGQAGEEGKKVLAGIWSQGFAWGLFFLIL